MATRRSLVKNTGFNDEIQDADTLHIASGITNTSGTLTITATSNILLSSNTIVQPGVTLSTAITGNINLPNNVNARFQIEGTAIGSTVTAANLGTLTSGANADALHAHSLSSPGKNGIINGKFDVWQRGTSFPTMAGSTNLADCCRYDKVGTMVQTGARDTNIPVASATSVLSNYSLKLSVTTAQVSLAATDYATIIHPIEGYNWANFAQRACVLSFWVYSNKTGIYSIGIKNGGQDRSFVAEYTINTTNTWEKKTITIAASPVAGTWDYINGAGVYILWALGVGTTNQTSTLNAWQTGSFFASTNQVNGLDSTSNTFYISQAQLEVGSSASGFEILPFQEQLVRCQRYFWKTFPYDTAPAQNAGVAGAIIDNPTSTQIGSMSTQIRFNMRTTPTLISYNPNAANSSWRRVDNVDITSSFTNPTDTGTNIGNAVSTLDAFNHAIHVTADAGL